MIDDKTLAEMRRRNQEYGLTIEAAERLIDEVERLRKDRDSWRNKATGAIETMWEATHEADRVDSELQKWKAYAEALEEAGEAMTEVLDNEYRDSPWPKSRFDWEDAKKGRPE